ncbi:polysaccharide biosynthesis/export family protein [Prosthecobacter sp.]|uniref:polysaccharide biosynthesis/export family protein n=1 Tax=Prosthecobacter sp. TaxID=1965333 RepID=UPI002ABB10C2|nr:polysaccharide biosynthesis/export family protein [Prosthecobacter sp.]MDZ4402114.1 polysaccharide biosynthesis/export family protein [Prosthecobacter sp.]
MEALDNAWQLKPENTISIRILEDKRDALQQRVAITGEIHVPYLGLIKAEGLTCRELALKIKAGLEKEFFKIATVLVTKDEDVIPKVVKCFLQPPTVVLFGKAKRTGIYDLPTDRDQTVSGLLEKAGGHTSEETAPKIRVVRKTPLGNKTILVNSKAVLIQKRPEFDLFLREGDVMFVE